MAACTAETALGLARRTTVDGLTPASACGWRRARERARISPGASSPYFESLGALRIYGEAAQREIDGSDSKLGLRGVEKLDAAGVLKKKRHRWWWRIYRPGWLHLGMRAKEEGSEGADGTLVSNSGTARGWG